MCYCMIGSKMKSWVERTGKRSSGIHALHVKLSTWREFCRVRRDQSVISIHSLYIVQFLMTKPKEACLFQSALVRSPSTPDCGGRGEGVLGPEGVFVCVHVCVDQLPRMASNSYFQASGSWFSVSGKHIFGLPISWTLRRVTIFKQVSKTIAYKCWLSHNICWTTVWKNKNTNTSITFC